PPPLGPKTLTSSPGEGSPQTSTWSQHMFGHIGLLLPAGWQCGVVGPPVEYTFLPKSSSLFASLLFGICFSLMLLKVPEKKMFQLL
uniref:Uncharacterized protein n=1 Tax=Chelonoidis abingdonii TaxID=106734 RepID=A0A8C0J7A5_CHEAB